MSDCYCTGECVRTGRCPNADPTDKSGFFDLPHMPYCTHPEHRFPTHLYIPPGKGYRHVCPGCGKEQIAVATQIS